MPDQPFTVGKEQSKKKHEIFIQVALAEIWAGASPLPSELPRELVGEKEPSLLDVWEDTVISAPLPLSHCSQSGFVVFQKVTRTDKWTGIWTP